MRSLLAIVLIIGVLGFRAFMVPTAYSGKDRMDLVISVLGQTSTGKIILERARVHWGFKSDSELRSVFRWGEVSKTDAILTRHFDPLTGTETRERKVSVILRQDQEISALVLDLAHELVHATSGPSWDPYDPELTPAKYIRAAIERKGGEVDALTQECRVALELPVGLKSDQSRCSRYFRQNGAVVEIDRKKILKDFYRVGRWRLSLAQGLGKDIQKFPHLSDRTPQLFSSTGKTPYPVALFWEYKNMTRVACENSKKRMGYSRSVASESTSKDDAAKFIVKRCNQRLGS